jgi:hypothetical protein
MRAVIFAALLSVAWAPMALANQYAKLFKTTSHDFGAVAKAAKTEFRFEFDNPFNKPIHVVSVRTSCGCTTPIIEQDTIEPGKKGAILARFNTGTHSGARGATVTVTFDKPSFGEVQLQVKGYIRTDVVMNPGEVSFGNVAQGDSKSLTVSVDYAGKPSWQINKIHCDETFIHVETKQVARNNGRVSYLLDVRLDNTAPAGPIQSEIVLHTNDRNLTTVPLRLVANVISEITVSPNLLSLGDVKANNPIQQLLVIKDQQPFQILGIESEKFRVEAKNLGGEPKNLYTIPLTLHPLPTEEIGDIRSKLIIKTDRPAKPVVEIDILHRIKQSIEPEVGGDDAADTDEMDDEDDEDDDEDDDE